LAIGHGITNAIAIGGCNSAVVRLLINLDGNMPGAAAESLSSISPKSFYNPLV